MGMALGEFIKLAPHPIQATIWLTAGGEEKQLPLVSAPATPVFPSTRLPYQHTPVPSPFSPPPSQLTFESWQDEVTLQVCFLTKRWDFELGSAQE
jgi:hypothetical protein